MEANIDWYVALCTLIDKEINKVWLWRDLQHFNTRRSHSTCRGWIHTYI